MYFNGDVIKKHFGYCEVGDVDALLRGLDGVKLSIS